MVKNTKAKSLDPVINSTLEEIIREQSGTPCKEYPFMAKTKRQLKIHKFKEHYHKFTAYALGIPGYLYTCGLCEDNKSKIGTHIRTFNDLKLHIEFDHEDIVKEKAYFEKHSINNPPTRNTIYNRDKYPH